MKIAASIASSTPATIPSFRGHERITRTSAGNCSMSRFSPVPWESATTTSVAPAALAARRPPAPARHELAEAAVLEPGGESWSAVTVPATPSMSTEMCTFSFRGCAWTRSRSDERSGDDRQNQRGGEEMDSRHVRHSWPLG
jgi:hypothetical protein